MSFSEDDLSVKVAVRIRPQIEREVSDGCCICTNVTPGNPQVTLGSDKSFTYDFVFDTHENQQTIYENCASSLVAGALQGYNATVLAYGQTQSGKTYTMGTGFNLENIDDTDPTAIGIIPRAIHQLFDGIQSIKQQSLDVGDPSPHFAVTVQFLELYNEKIIDLFDKNAKGIRIHEDMQHNIYVNGVSPKPINSASEALSYLRKGASSRTTAATALNSHSSRSHAVFTINIRQKRLVKHKDEGTESTLEDGGTNPVGNQNPGEFVILTAKFHFVDLAGSERLKRTGATGDRAKEGISINCVLLALGNVISALGDQSKKNLHVPYRDSALTRLLQDSLGGNSRTVMIACVSPSDRDVTETLNTLNYANRARNIQNKVVINSKKTKTYEDLLLENTILKTQMKAIQEENTQLLAEIMEYKQGKRTVNDDGEECVTVATGGLLNNEAGIESNMTDVIQDVKPMTGEPSRNDNKCPFCGHHYDNLKRHLVVHTGEKAYACRLCRTGFGQKSSLVRHLMSVLHKDVTSSSSGTERAVFNCCFCKLMFETSKELSRHITYNHENLLLKKNLDMNMS